MNLEEINQNVRALKLTAETFHNFLDMEIAIQNRERNLGFLGKASDHYHSPSEEMHAMKLMLRKAMIKAFRRLSPAVSEWAKTTPGIGEHTMARLLGEVGHPALAIPYHWEGDGDERVLIADDPYIRTVSQLWSYCGHGDPQRRLKKGIKADELLALGDPTAKMLTYLQAVACVKVKNSPFRLTYDEARTKYADRVHTTECVRCGPSGKPAEKGSSWSLGHQNAAAIRKVGKEILKQAWIVSLPEIDQATEIADSTAGTLDQTNMDTIPTSGTSDQTKAVSESRAHTSDLIGAV